MSNAGRAGPGERAARAVTAATEATRKDAAKSMRRPTPRKVRNLATRALDRAEALIKDVLELVPPPRPIACKAGCPWCCHIRLTASPPEVFLVLKFIRDTFSRDEMAALRRKVANIDPVTRGRGGEDRARLRLPCPLLKDGSCSVHPVRPLSCRAVVSVDLAACIRSYESRMQDPVPQHEFQYQAANAVGYGLHAGLADADFPMEDVEMNAALALGLAEADLEKRWAEGKPVLAPATVVRTE